MSQVIKKRRIVLASVLKPVDDTRMYEKIGQSLVESGFYDVTIIGYPSKLVPSNPKIEFISLDPFNRLSFKRLLVPFKIFSIINQVKPELLVINTPELLVVAILNRILFGRKICYDILENYYRTIRYTPTYLAWIRKPLAAIVRLIEVLSRPFINQYFLAEKGYQNEVHFAKPHIVLQNKFPLRLSTQVSKNDESYSKLVFTGTLSPTTGILEAIDLCQQLHKVDREFTLTIIGYCALPQFLKQIKSKIYDSPFIQLIGGDYLVPHDEILKEICNSDFGIIVYSVNSSTINCIPTKLWEYLALGLPILIQHNQDSHELVKSNNAGFILTEFQDYSQLSNSIQHFKRSKKMPDESIYWESDESKLIHALNNI